MSSHLLNLYFDGQCPFCTIEMARLRQWDRAGKLQFTDITLPGFDAAAHGLEFEALGLQLHSKTADGRILAGLDSMLAAYTLAGKGFLVWPLRIRPLKPLLAMLYRGFARNRYRVSSLLGPAPVPRCDGDTCSVNPFLNK